MTRAAGAVIDAIVENHGSIMLFRTHTKGIRDWFRENTDAPSLGASFAVEPRYVVGIVEALRGEGFVVE